MANHRSDFHIGQQLVLTGVNWRDRTELVSVTKIGRTNLSVRWCGRDKQFRIADGSEVGDFSHHRVYTQDGWVDYQRREKVWTDLNAHGINIASYRRRELSTDQLTAIAAAAGLYQL